MADSLRDPRYRAVVARLIAMRKAAGFTQRDVAERLGRTPSYLAKVEIFERRADILQLLEFLDGLGADPNTFLKDTVAHWKRSKSKRS